MIKVEVKEQESVKEQSYPCLMEGDDGFVVLFSYAKKGICIAADEPYHHNIGRYSEGWDMEHFTPLPAGTQIIITQQ